MEGYIKMVIQRYIDLLVEQEHKKTIRDRVEVFVFRDGKVLSGKVGNRLIFPGGGIDEGENIKQAGRRETVEETGVYIQNLKILNPNDPLYLDYEELSNNGDTYAKYKMERLKKYKGENTYFIKSEYVEREKEDLKKDEWYIKDITWKPIDELVQHMMDLQESIPTNKLKTILSPYYQFKMEMLWRCKNEN